MLRNLKNSNLMSWKMFLKRFLHLVSNLNNHLYSNHSNNLNLNNLASIPNNNNSQTNNIKVRVTHLNNKTELYKVH